MALFPRYIKSLQGAIPKIGVMDLHAAFEREKGGPMAALLDVREPYEWNESHIPAAMYTGRGKLELDIELRFPDPNQEIICYCGNGNRSILAADSLRRMGYKNVSYIDGGFYAWKEEGMPIVKNVISASERMDMDEQTKHISA